MVPVLSVDLACVLVFLTAPGGSVVQSVAACIPFIMVPAVLGARSRAVDRSHRRHLRPLLAASTVYATAMLLWYLAPSLGLDIPFPSVLDVVFFGVFIAYTWFLATVLRRWTEARPLENRLALVDAVLLTATVCSLLWTLVIAPNLGSESTPSQTLFSLLYSALSVVMFAVAARLAASTGFLGRSSGWLLLTWVACEVTGDAVYGFEVVNGTFEHSSTLTATWVVGYAALGTLAAHADLVRIVDPTPEHRFVDSSAAVLRRPLFRAARRTLVLLPAVAPFVLAVVDRRHTVLMLAVGIGAFCLVVYRTVLLSGDLHEQRRLTAELDAAVERLAEQRDHLERLAFTDGLTGLGNRALFTRRVREALDTAGGRRGAGPVPAVVMLDLDDFKIVNDSLGHDTGDALLVAVARRLSAAVGDRGTATRLGGDEFAVVVGSTSGDTAREVAESIVAALAEPFRVTGYTLRASGSIGIAYFEEGLGPDELLRNADLAMYAAKGAGQGAIRAYRPAFLHDVRSRQQLESRLWTALEHGQVSVAYQAIVDARTQAPVCLEALARWSDPEAGAVPPGRFIPVAEASGIIGPLGELVLRTACADAARLPAGHGPVGVAVNVSVRQFQSPEFAAFVAATLADTGLPPQLLTLEVTESLVMDDDPRIVTNIATLAELGVQLSIDDFGTGQSSLARLRALPVHQLKIDRSLVQGLTEDASYAPIVGAVTSMARALGLAVVAEGVETGSQLDAVVDLGCDLVQGFLLSRPVPIAELLASPVWQQSPATAHPA